ncbi:family 2A encapsulin nanocompartment cargo protein cysteine desulfurase [Siphonobacter sp. SORGH_AS_0500]|uniref:family 2A encapsulin nanocompartment cargo protein cysteine desulfurase n=1 Tax=Siphonobacter sp. SORGH_AS_0500 TaxID=1864824 RepID=UPI00285F5390|nr:family 2A encapsulin nanocompartment cargo protein cysteine desulfurase [Siphonobacter sp. SORGH_AS_0500]MDR6197642.1 cysteine desulfurase/selenocysteine lyase [Siphonobacter sp. SORGH_AS_0500]
MSINTSQPSEIPDAAVLQDIANQLFKALPEEVPKDFSLDPATHPKAWGVVEHVLGGNIPSKIEIPAVNPVSAVQTPTAFGGFGGSPTGVSSLTGFVPAIENVASPSAVNPPYTSGIPNSVAGSGASPSYAKQGDSFNINKPETSFPDENIASSKQQQDVHADPLLYPNVQIPFFENVSDFLSINEVLQQIRTSEPAPQITSFSDRFIPNSYYFLPEDVFHEKVNYSSFGGSLGELVRKDFPILEERVNGRRLVWFDNAATTQKPQAVIDRISYFYQHENSNIHRAAHELAARATDAYEAAREKVRAFLGAKSTNEIIFVRGATEAINLVAQSWGDQNLQAGDEIIVSNLEHHANIVPWKRLSDRKGLKLKVIPVNDDGELLLEEYAKLLTPKTKLVAVTQVSNALGTVTPVQQIVAMAQAVGAKTLVDGAQSVSHMPINVQAINADFFVFSGHKVFGPTGIGVLYGKEEILNATEPWQGGGNMIQDVTFEHIKYHNAPNRFEAGTGNIADAVGLGAAIDYVTKIGMEVIGQYEHALLEYATHYLKPIKGVRLIGTARQKASVLSFTLQGYTNDEVGKALNEEGIAVRTGHHCAQPILRRLGVETTVRPSLAFYNTYEDVDRFIAVIQRLSSRK